MIKNKGSIRDQKRKSFTEIYLFATDGVVYYLVDTERNAIISHQRIGIGPNWTAFLSDMRAEEKGDDEWVR